MPVIGAAGDRRIPAMIVARDASTEGINIPENYAVAGIVPTLEAAAALIPSIAAQVVIVEDDMRRQPGFAEMLGMFRAVFPSVRVEYFRRADGAGTVPSGQGTPAADTPGREAGREARGTASPTDLRGAVVVVWGPKGGVGRTFLSCNLAAAAARRRIQPVCLVDLDSKAGDVSAHLDLGDGPTILEALPYAGEGYSVNFERSVMKHRKTGVNVLAAPARPELSELVKPEDVRLAMEALRQHHAVVFVDTPADPAEEMFLDYLERAWRTVLVVTQDVACLRRTKAALDLMDRLHIALGERTVLVVNRSMNAGPLDAARIEVFLGMKPAAVVPEDRRNVDESIYRGVPVVLLAPNEAVARAVDAVASRLFGGPASAPTRMDAVRSVFRNVIPRRRLNGGRPA